MKTTVFIPALPKSLKNLNNIIEVYNNGTVKPDEIIINISMVNNDIVKYLMDLKNLQYNIKLFTHQYKMDAGTNRQMAKYLATGDIILYQDDDDIPSERRVEIVKNFFEHTDIMCLAHGYVYNKELPDISNICVEDIKTISSSILYRKYFPNGKLEECKNITDAYGGEFNIAVCAGPICIRKEVLDVIKWKNNQEITLCKYGSIGKGEDYDFCMEVLHKYNMSILIDIPLYRYLK